jgi:hypothetical protein
VGVFAARVAVGRDVGVFVTCVGPCTVGDDGGAGVSVSAIRVTVARWVGVGVVVGALPPQPTTRARLINARTVMNDRGDTLTLL